MLNIDDNRPYPYGTYLLLFYSTVCSSLQSARAVYTVYISTVKPAAGPEILKLKRLSVLGRIFFDFFNIVPIIPNPILNSGE